MIVKTKDGWQVKSADGTKALSDDDLSRAQAEVEEKRIGDRQPSLVWASERGKIVKER